LRTLTRPRKVESRPRTGNPPKKKKPQWEKLTESQRESSATRKLQEMEKGEFIKATGETGEVRGRHVKGKRSQEFWKKKKKGKPWEGRVLAREQTKEVRRGGRERGPKGTFRDLNPKLKKKKGQPIPLALEALRPRPRKLERS